MYLSLTCVMIVEAPGLDVVLRELGVGEQLDGVRHQLHIALGELLQLQLHQADLTLCYHRH